MPCTDGGADRAQSRLFECVGALRVRICAGHVFGERSECAASGRYAGSRRIGQDGRVCYHGGSELDADLYETLGHAEVVQARGGPRLSTVGVS